jgi:hypothetical protein
MGLESAASRSLVSSSSPIAGAVSNSSSLMILGLFVSEFFVRDLGLTFEVGPSDASECAAATSFKAVVRAFACSDLGLALRLERDGVLWPLWDLFPVDLGINCQRLLFLDMLPTLSACQPIWWLITAENRTIILKNQHQSRLQLMGRYLQVVTVSCTLGHPLLLLLFPQRLDLFKFNIRRLCLDRDQFPSPSLLPIGWC